MSTIISLFPFKTKQSFLVNAFMAKNPPHAPTTKTIKAIRSTLNPNFFISLFVSLFNLLFDLPVDQSKPIEAFLLVLPVVFRVAIFPLFILMSISYEFLIFQINKRKKSSRARLLNNQLNCKCV